jgi:hypothetical protein
MLENAACQEIMNNSISSYGIVRRNLRARALKMLELEVNQSSVAVATETLLIVNELLITELSNWAVVLRDLTSVYNAQSPQANISSQRVLSWAMARFSEFKHCGTLAEDCQLILLDIAASILSSQPTVADLEQYDMSQIRPANDIQDAIILCARTVNLNLAPSIHSIGTREEWSRLHTIMEDWQLCLVTGVQPLLAINGAKAVASDDISTSFPVVIYSNRFTFYTSFLFHLSCLMLAQNRPHSLRRMKSTCLRTIAYHSVHLCGISRSNSLAWSWDPILVATLLFVGKFLSYHGQQIELLQHLTELTGLTGWKTSKEIDRLQEHWRVGQ